MSELIGYLSEAEHLEGMLSGENQLEGELSIPEVVGGGLSEEVKQALLDLFQHLAYTDADGQDYYDALYNAFYPPAELTSISAVYTQSGSVFPDTPLDDLKDDLVVTAHYSDSTTEVVPSADYTLSGTLTAGASTITVTYEDKTTTFNVTVSAPAVLSSITAVYTQSGTVYPTDSLDSLKPDLVVTAHYSDSSTATVTTYTLSGTLTVGMSTITVTYSGKTTTFNVTVTAVPVLDSITAVYTQSGTVYDTDSLDSLKADLVVTAVYSDSSTAVVPSTDYTLSGTLTVGTSTVTVSYEGKTTTFNVTVSQPLPYTFYDYLTLTYELNANMAANDGILTDIAFAPNQTLETTIYYEGTISSACPIMGIREGQNGTKDFALFVTPSNGKCGYWYGGTDTTQGFLPFVRNQLNTVKVQPVGVSQTYPSNATLNINGTDYNTGSTTASGTWPSWLGFFKYGISATSTSTGVNDKYPKLRIGETIIKSGTTVLHDLKPAYHNTTQYYGFYDAVTDTFYYSERNNAHISAGDYT